MRVVEMRDVCRDFAGDPPVHAVVGIDLDIEQGEYLSIVGPSGSGKSTLLHLLGLLDQQTSGSYLLDGTEVAGCTERERARLRSSRIGFVFQAFHLLPYRTVVENVLLGVTYATDPSPKRRHEAMELLDRVGLTQRHAASPAVLSGGERQRVAVARALLGGPSLLLADEPTGNLDSASSEMVLGLFDELHAEGMTVAVITHDMGVSARAQRCVRIVDGRLADA